MRYKPKMRVYRCRNPKCRFVFHRDGVGSINIRRKYLGLGLVVGAMASPIGVRYHAHLRCSSGVRDRERIPVL
jgi:putative transposase